MATDISVDITHSKQDPKTIDTGLFPSQWKMAKVFPLYKKDDRADAQNYRPISVLPAISKICERVVYDQLYRYLNSNGLLTKSQSGFHSLHSTAVSYTHLTLPTKRIV